MDVLPLLSIAVFSTLALLLLWGLFLGYPRKRFASRVLTAKEQAIVTACADTLFPARDSMPLTGSEAGTVEYLDQHLADLPGDKRILIRLLFILIEHSPWIFGMTPRFSSLSEARRYAFLMGMANSRLYMRRLSFLSLRTLLCMAYFAHPEIAARVGSTPNTRPFSPS